MQKDTLFQIVDDAKTLVGAIKANNEKVLKQLYQENFNKIKFYIIKNNGSEQQAKDIYQEAFIVVWQNVKKNKFNPKNMSSISAYIYTIAKNKWTDYLRSSRYKKTLNSTDFQLNNAVEEVEEKIIDDNSYSNRLNRGMSAFNNLGASCKELLTKFYFEKKSMKEIAAELQLDSASTRNKKYRCMMKLKKLALK